jgi:hypothetical protein
MKTINLFILTTILVIISILSFIFLPFFGVFIIASVVGISIPAVHYSTVKENRKKTLDREDDFELLSTENGFDEILFKEFEEEQREIGNIFVLIGNDRILELLDSGLDLVSMLDFQNFPLTTITPQFWNKFNQLEFEKHEKLAFIKEVLSFPLDERENIITSMLQMRENQNKKKEIRVLEG